MAVHRHRILDVSHLVALGAAPAGVLVVLRILKVLAESPQTPDIPPEAAADHAEEVVPRGGLAPGAKAALIVAGKNCPAIRARNLSAKHRRRFRILQGKRERAQPAGALGRGIRIEEKAGVVGRQTHAMIHDPARIVLLRCDLHEVVRLSRANQVLGAVRAATVDHDKLDGRVPILRGKRRKRFTKSPGFIEAAHDDADGEVVHAGCVVGDGAVMEPNRPRNGRRRRMKARS